MGNKLEGAVPKALMEMHNSGALTLKYGLLSKHSIQLFIGPLVNNFFFFRWYSTNLLIFLFIYASLDGNPEICVMDSCKGKKRKVVPIVVASVSVAILVLLCALAIFGIHKRKRQGNFFLHCLCYFNSWWKPHAFSMKLYLLMILMVGTKIQSKAKNWRFTYFEIVNITSNFTSVLGEGGFGRVYHGILKDTTQVAVKVLSSSSRQGSEEFQKEVDST